MFGLTRRDLFASGTGLLLVGTLLEPARLRHRHPFR